MTPLLLEALKYGAPLIIDAIKRWQDKNATVELPTKEQLEAELIGFAVRRQGQP